MTMTLEDRAKLAVHDLQAWPQRLDAQTDYILNMLRLAVADECEACAEIAAGLTIQVGDGPKRLAQDGHWIADTIRARSEPRAI